MRTETWPWDVAVQTEVSRELDQSSLSGALRQMCAWSGFMRDQEEQN